jgi:hypothetical protein
MHPLITAMLLLLSLTLTQTLAGMAMLRSGALPRRKAARFGKISTLFVVALGFLLNRSGWPGVSLDSVDLATFLLVLGLLAHATIWAGLAFQINQSALPADFEDSLYS